jgi:mono/diheme cytochrome c family protein
MKNSTRLKGIILLAAIIISSQAALGGATSRSVEPVADGNAVYAAKCGVCHGKDGSGTPNWHAKGQPDFTDARWQKSRTDAQIAGFTRDGKGKYMPGFKGKLSDEEIVAVVARIRAFGKK